MSLAINPVSPFGSVNPTAPANERPKEFLWGNVGYNVDVNDPETGEVEKIFVGIPIGIPMGTMEPVVYRGSNKKYAQLVSAKNQLLAQLQAMGAEMEPGATADVDGLVFQLKRVGEPAADSADDADNVLLGGLGNLKLAG